MKEGAEVTDPDHSTGNFYNNSGGIEDVWSSARSNKNCKEGGRQILRRPAAQEKMRLLGVYHIISLQHAVSVFPFPFLLVEELQVMFLFVPCYRHGVS